MLQTVDSTIRFSDGKRIIASYPEGMGGAEMWLGRHGHGIFAAGFGMGDLELTEAFLRQGGHATILHTGGGSPTL